MSELINNRENRQAVLKEIIKQLHEGKSVEEVKDQFETTFGGVSASEISDAESALIKEGVSITEIQSLCDVHAAVFKGSVEEIHQETDPSKMPGHPASLLKQENRVIEKWLDQILDCLKKPEQPESLAALRKAVKKLADIDKHYAKKENLWFPYMEKYGMAAPPQVMWGVDDDIRMLIQMAQQMISSLDVISEGAKKNIEGLVEKINEMIFKEENIMLPMLVEKLTEDEWQTIAMESSGFGYLVETVPTWRPKKNEGHIPTSPMPKAASGEIQLPTGSLSIEELMCVLNTLPFDMTFVSKEDVVKYFSEGGDRIFARTKTVIGRSVSNCHPPASVHIVEQLVADFKAGNKDSEDFWIRMGEKLVLIRYFAVRNEKKEYLGVLEVTSDIAPLQALTGEKRLVETLS